MELVNASGSNLARLVCQDRLQDKIKQIKDIPNVLQFPILVYLPGK
jgi:hypothetical protein